MTAGLDGPRTPVPTAVASCLAALDEVADAPLWALDEPTTRATLTELTRLAARVAELELRAAAHADRIAVGHDTGAASAAVWWAVATRQTRAETHRKVSLGRALDERYDAVRFALAAGDLLTDQAQVVVRALEALPDGLDPAVVAEAEVALVGYAAHHDARELRVLGRRILAVVAPDLDDAHEARLLDAEEKRAAETSRFTLSDDGHGLCHGRFTLPSASGAMLRKAVLGLAAPRHQAAGGPLSAERRPSPARLGEAFREYVERYPVDRLPHAGGVAATVVVTMTLPDLVGGAAGDQAGTTSLDTGQALTAAQARRWACEAGIIPVVLGGAGQPLDVGRKRRLFTEPQRIALAQRDGGCTAEGCDWPSGMCHSHHDHPWSHHGGTSLDNGRLLCPHHHARAHDPAYAMTRLGPYPGAKVSFIRRT